jgi:hypothetical protein
MKPIFPRVAVLLFVPLLVCVVVGIASAQTSGIPGAIVSGTKWNDTNGKRIQAHGGGILLRDGTYYWYGEDKTLGNFNKTGVSCYSSKDLLAWKHEGVVLPKEKLPVQFQDSGVCERPKVIYCAVTKKYVMWMHLDTADYAAACAGIAVADTAAGPFEYLGSQRPIKFDGGRSSEKGSTYRDMNLFVDDDGQAYVLYAGEGNSTLYICRLNREFTGVEQPVIEGKTWSRNFIGASREAPAPFKSRGKYFIFTSGCTGWAPNPADYAVADNILGPWVSRGNPCIGTDSETTFRSQSTYVLPASGQPDGNFIFMADRWFGGNEDSRYVWLPFTVRPDNSIVLEFLPDWDLSIFKKKHFDETAVPDVALAPVPANAAKLGAELSWKPVSGADFYRVYRNGFNKGATRALDFKDEDVTKGWLYAYEVEAATIHGGNSRKSARLDFSTGPATNAFLSDIKPDFCTQGYGTLQRDKTVGNKKITLGGKEFEKGLGVHAKSVLVYVLHGKYCRFTAWAGADKEAKGTVGFTVLCDGRECFKSGVMTPAMEPAQVTVNLSGVNELKLVVDDGGDGNGNDHADWADAKIKFSP